MPIALLIDDNEDLEVLFAQHLEPQGFNLEQETDPDNACEAINRHKPDIVLLDLHFPGDDGHDAGQTTGVRLNAEIRNKYPNLAVLIFTRHRGLLDIPSEHFSGTEPHAQQLKPDFSKEAWGGELANTMRTALELVRPFDADRDSERLGFIIGEMKQMQLVFKQTTTYAQQLKNVIIYGEQGTGKSLVAQAIHKLSGRPEEKFHEFNCQVNGRDKAKLKDALQKVEGGTLYLSDIQLLEPELQECLIAEQTETRLIAGTHKSLDEMIDNDGFHNDLADCLVDYVINLPSLKKRLDDDEGYLSKLFRHFVGKTNNQIDSSFLHTEIVEKIRGYDWPKNVREFKRVINQAVNMAVAEGSNVLLPKHLASLGPVRPRTGDKKDSLEEQYRNFIACKEPYDKYQFLLNMRTKMEQSKKERADLLIRFICCDLSELRAREGVAISHNILFDAIHGEDRETPTEKSETAHSTVRKTVTNILRIRGITLSDLTEEYCKKNVKC